ncbi:hypothetical protein EYF80_011911 [Liparis tanakae]|uniref:Uncharacterized protein n=1 Tax=Liparis tanakae TaxID=230148 RepID=A0A4Z2IK55_9TELE|nr:hypothetical protein EYF80_011911 [Liparis tanakae]
MVSAPTPCGGPDAELLRRYPLLSGSTYLPYAAEHRPPLSTGSELPLPRALGVSGEEEGELGLDEDRGSPRKCILNTPSLPHSTSRRRSGGKTNGNSENKFRQHMLKCLRRLDGRVGLSQAARWQTAFKVPDM